MRLGRRAGFWALVVAVLVAAVPLGAAEPARTFSPGRHGPGRLEYIGNVPVLVTRGTPEQIGRQTAHLLGNEAEQVLDYPRRVFASGPDGEAAWSRLMEAARQLKANIPPAHRTELEVTAKLARLDVDVLAAGNVVMDVYRGLGCSSLQVAPERSCTGGVLFGRNLDFPSAGYLHRYSIVTVCHPEGKRAFASVGFAGLFGCLSGMNDAGLTLAVHEVLVSRDGSRLFNPKGVPYAFLFRRILEECGTVDEAERLLQSVERTTMYNLAVADRNRTVVFEVTPKSVVRREGEGGLCACTNHFRTNALAIFPVCDRYEKLSASTGGARLGIPQVAARLHAANLGQLTLQTMVFEPGPLRLHLALGNLPASAGPLEVIELAPLLATEATKQKTDATERVPPGL